MGEVLFGHGPSKVQERVTSEVTEILWSSRSITRRDGARKSLQNFSDKTSKNMNERKRNLHVSETLSLVSELRSNMLQTFPHLE